MYYTYILLCRDNTLYTGSTDDPEKRLKKHNAGQGAKYLRGRTPAKIVYLQRHKNRGFALKREAAIKKLSRQDKIELIRSGGGTGRRVGLKIQFH